MVYRNRLQKALVKAVMALDEAGEGDDVVEEVIKAILPLIDSARRSVMARSPIG